MIQLLQAAHPSDLKDAWIKSVRLSYAIRPYPFTIYLHPQRANFKIN
jgi:hypothetical protein